MIFIFYFYIEWLLFAIFRNNLLQEMKSIIFIIILVSSLFFIACKHDKTAAETTQQASVTASYKMLPPEQQVVIDVVNRWNAVHDSVMIDSLTPFYNDQVMFFKKRVARKTVIDTKK